MDREHESLWGQAGCHAAATVFGGVVGLGIFHRSEIDLTRLFRSWWIVRPMDEEV